LNKLADPLIDPVVATKERAVIIDALKSAAEGLKQIDDLEAIKNYLPAALT